MKRSNAIVTIIIIMLLVMIITNRIDQQRNRQYTETYTANQEAHTEKSEALERAIEGTASGECVYAVDSTVTKIAGSLVEITDCTGNVWLVDSSTEAHTLTEAQKVCTVFNDRGTHDDGQDDEVLCILTR